MRGNKRRSKTTSLPDAYQQIFRTQSLDNTGTVLRDFEALLRFVGPDGISVSDKYNLLPMARLAQLNAQMTHPVEIALKRPQQRSYPHINGLYILLRITGLACVEGAGKKQRLVVDDSVLQSWRSLNATEQYCTLLEAWLLRWRLEIVGEHAPLFDNPLMMWAEFFRRIPKRGLRIAGDASQEQTITYLPGMLTVAMLELFGLIAVQHATPEAGKGWRIARVRKTPFGEALLYVLSDLLPEDAFLWQYDSGAEMSFGVLQAALQPVFPAWQQNLHLPEPEFQSGTYIFKVSLGSVWRRIAIPGESTLDGLSYIILQAYNFDQDHLYKFTYKNRFGVPVDITHPYIEESPCSLDILIGDLQMKPGATMTYLYDFGDRWEFNVRLERIDPVDPKIRMPQIIEAHGKAPDQYMDWSA